MLDTSIVNVSLPSMRADLGFSSGGLHWVVNAYTLAAAGFLLLGGRAADVFGRREVFVGGLALFGLASLMGGLAREPAILVAARAGQGLGGALVAPTSLSILATTFREGPERNRAFGLWGTLGALGGASGALVGGVLTETLSWRAVLLVNTPLALGTALVALKAMPVGQRRHDLQRAARSFDVVGAVTVTCGLVLVSYAIVSSREHGWAAATTIASLVGGGTLLALFALVEARVAMPLVPLGVFRSRALSGSTGVIVCLGATAVSMWFFVSLYVQQILGFSALQAGLVFLPMSLMIVACTQVASRLAGRVGPGWMLTVGMTLLGIGMLLLSRAGVHGSWVRDVLGPTLLCAAGIGSSFVSTTIAANTGVPAQRSGLASGVINTAFQIGGSLGLATLATLSANAGGGTLTALSGGFQRAFLAGGVVALAGAAVAMVVIVRAPRPGRTYGERA